MKIRITLDPQAVCKYVARSLTVEEMFSSSPWEPEEIMWNEANRICVPAVLKALILLATTLWELSPPVRADDVPNLPRIQERAAKGFVEDEISLAAAYFTGKGLPLSPSMAARWYERAAGHGDPGAQNMIGFLYQAGIGVPIDRSRALYWYRLAASSGLPAAEVNLGVCYLFGVGVLKDSNTAIHYFEEAVQKKAGEAATYLGLIYYSGFNVAADQAAGEKWFNVGLKLHDPAAAYEIGTLLSVQPGHAHDPQRALKFFRQAAGEGYIAAYYSLGLMLLRQPELANSPDEARTALEIGESQGYWKASMLLGVVYRDGRGAAADPKAAYYHFYLASLLGREAAKNILSADLESLRTRLLAPDLEAAKMVADRWHEQHEAPVAFIYNSAVEDKRFPIAAVVYPRDGEFAGPLIPFGRDSVMHAERPRDSQ